MQFLIYWIVYLFIKDTEGNVFQSGVISLIARDLVAVLRLKHTNKPELFLQIIFVVCVSFEKEVTF